MVLIVIEHTTLWAVWCPVRSVIHYVCGRMMATTADVRTKNEGNRQENGVDFRGIFMTRKETKKILVAPRSVVDC